METYNMIYWLVLVVVMLTSYQLGLEAGYKRAQAIVERNIERLKEKIEKKREREGGEND